MSVYGIQRRMVELGRIRMGDQVATRSGKRRPRALDAFRLTSASEQLLNDAARLYGGTVQPWEDAPSEGYYELTTTSTELDVLLPPLHDDHGRPIPPCTVHYEHWQGGTCERRCDGITEQLSGEPCLCAVEISEEKERTCKPVTRLLVMLPRVRGLGVWRLEARGYNAAASLPGTAELLAYFAGPGQLARGVLRLEQRTEKKRNATGGVETRHYVVPVLGYPGTLQAALDARPALPAFAAGSADTGNLPPLRAGGDVPAVAGPADDTPTPPVARPRPPRERPRPVPKATTQPAEPVDSAESPPEAAPVPAQAAPVPGSREDRALSQKRIAIWRIIRPILAARQPGRPTAEIHADGRALLGHLAGRKVTQSRDLTEAELVGVLEMLSKGTPSAEEIVDEWLTSRE